MSLDFTDDQSTLVQVMAWCCQATSHNLSQCWPKSFWANVDPNLCHHMVSQGQNELNSSLVPSRCKDIFKNLILNNNFAQLLWNYTGTWVNIGSGNVLVQSGNKPLSDPMLTQFCHHLAPLRHTEFMCWFVFNKHNCEFIFCIIPHYWNHAVSWNLTLRKITTWLLYIDNIMFPNGLVTQGAKAPADMVLTQFALNIPLPTQHQYIQCSAIITRSIFSKIFTKDTP